MYVAVFVACGLSALLIEGFITLTDDFRTYADARLAAATENAIHSKLTRSARGQ